jgi:hypothetical protein
MRTMKLASWLFVGLVVLGCTGEPKALTGSSPALLATRPVPAVNVIEAKRTAKDEDEVILTGRIGGDAKPFIDGVAAFTIVDMSLKFCADEEGCPTPWDYCCVTDQLPDRKALIKVVDAAGKPIASDARQLLGVKELSTVTVKGIADRDDAGNLTVLARGVFVDAK